LFRRAVQLGDEGAWAFIYTFYSTEAFLGDHYVLKWVRSWMQGRHGALIRAAYTEDEFVQEVWLRFMHSDAARSFRFESMAHLMAYLRRLVNNFALDIARRRAPDVVEPSTIGEAADLEQAVHRVPDHSADLEARLALQESLESLLAAVRTEIVATEHEWLVFRDHFLEGLPPREVYRMHPGIFLPNEVEITRTRLARRLRKAPFLLVHYIELVVLEDDERLTLVFRRSILEGAPDDLLLARFGGLFRDAKELARAKASVFEAMQRRPALLQLFSS
jgi:DNA-directed RNA polymerase specialized sigma24 family protein